MKALDVVKKFNQLDFHDDGLKAIKVCPPRGKDDCAGINLEFLDDSTEATKLLSFRNCANVRYVMDFDVLAANWFAPTEKAVSVSDARRMRKFVRGQIRNWHVTFMPPGPKDRPIKRKLSTIRKYVLFKVSFFGGSIEVLAKNFTLRRLKKV